MTACPQGVCQKNMVEGYTVLSQKWMSDLITDFSVIMCNVQYLVSWAICQGSHASWKVLDFFVNFPGLGKSWKMALVLESPGNFSERSWKVLDFFSELDTIV